jgi:hypothetical protein
MVEFLGHTQTISSSIMQVHGRHPLATRFASTWLIEPWKKKLKLLVGGALRGFIWHAHSVPHNRVCSCVFSSCRVGGGPWNNTQYKLLMNSVVHMWWKAMNNVSFITSGRLQYILLAWSFTKQESLRWIGAIARATAWSATAIQLWIPLRRAWFTLMRQCDHAGSK